MASEEIYKYYSRSEVQEAILDSAFEREVGVRYEDGGFGKRPDILQYPNDVLHLVKGNALAFNISEERWSDPLKLKPGMKRSDLDELRMGWDLILDIDCDHVEYAKIAADLIIKILEHYNCPNTIKFSGRAGFHIGVPFEAFPEKVKGKLIKNMFPEAPQIIAKYIADLLKPSLREELLKKSTLKELHDKTQIPMDKLCPVGELDPFAILHIDSLLISSRHLFRAPYSINQKSGLISLPIAKDNILTFDLSSAKPEVIQVKTELTFLDRSVEKNSAQTLFELAFDAEEFRKAKETSKNEYRSDEVKEFEPLKDAIPEAEFPPCIKNILTGLHDGKKRAVFVLINFLANAGWTYNQIKERLNEWNKNNPDPLRDRDIQAQINYAKAKKKPVLPPNCNNLNYYVDLGVCKPDGLCSKIKNPFTYSLKKHNIKTRSDENSQSNKKQRANLTEEQKERRRVYREKLKNQNNDSTSQRPQPL